MDSTSASSFVASTSEESPSAAVFLLQEAGWFVMLVMMGFLGFRIAEWVLHAKKSSKFETSESSPAKKCSDDAETLAQIKQKHIEDLSRQLKEQKEKEKEKMREKEKEMSWRSTPALVISANSWVEQQKKRREHAASAKQSGPTDEEIARRMKGILNKLTLEKFDELYKQLLDCGISTEAHVRILVAEVFEKATTQHHFIEMYTTLCVSLSEWFSTHVKVGNFKRILLDQCQASFEANLQPPKEAPRKAQKGNTPDEDADAQEMWFKHKMRMLGNIKFFAQLIQRKMVASKVVIACSEELLAKPSPCNLESLAQLLTGAGQELDVPTWTHHAALCAVFSKMKELTKDKSVPSRTRFLLQDVIDLRDNGWVDKKVATTKLERPKKLEEIHNSEQ
eukprot:gnl/TRDRNA2_/TRDRNA2_178206_c0_seq1.p1 gnl/TRDRNA2_/TRDRNA2_178206_c0~~gnl/TRDRNA2_/TRDRNA2_178206_c0_seq1.p1  ORF type:complete len:393 (-),score=108.19 gnl/TRDRNA2_/TRDRNA2_178206_c0_seq1:116-1294(-)